MSPAAHVINVFGGVNATAKALGRSAPSISKWTKPISEKGTGGFIPSKAQQIIFKIARRKKLDITAEDLILGRKKKR